MTSAVRRTPFTPARASEGALAAPRGAFVSLHEAGRLRGCIGYIDPLRALLDTVERSARKAATEDHRFEPVAPDELSAILIEISVLSLPEEFHEPQEIEIGTHGILIETRHRRGILLPQVARDQGWDPMMFLRHTAEKAGLPSGAWNAPGVILSRFTAEIVSEDPDRVS